MMRYYDFSEPRRPTRRVKRKNAKLLSFMLLAFVVFPAIIAVYFTNKDVLVAKQETLAVSIAPSPTAIPTPTNSPTLDLDAIIQEELEGTKGKYSVVVRDLQTGAEYKYKEQEKFQTGSLYKLWVMAVVNQQIQEGKLKESDVLASDVAVINSRFNIATDAAEMKDGSVAFPVNQAMKQMITISHNYAALLLAQKVKLSSITKFLQDNNFSNSKVGSPPQTTAYDMANFLDALYDGKLANAERTTVMIDLLKAQRLNNKLPKNLPPGTVVAHKTGELGQVTHDAGIVYTSKGNYIIVVLSESTLPSAAEDRIANISKAVFEYYETR